MAHGRTATAPSAIPPAGWLDILWRIKDRIGKDRLPLIAAGIAFFGLLALFPTITALLAIGGLILDPAQIIDLLSDAEGVVPEDVLSIIRTQAESVAGIGDSSLGWTLAISLGLALWSSSRGVANFIQGLNVVYGEDEKRGLIKLNLQVLALTLVMIIGFVLSIALIVALPVAMAFIDLGPVTEWLIRIAQLLIIAALIIGGLSVMYRFGPSRADAKWKWITPGSVFATIGLALASIGFTVYVSRFASYNESFGTLAGVIILLMWLWITALVTLIGGEVNAEMEAQTRRDTTTGRERPMGERGAVKADHLGEARSEEENTES